ncbi:MAG: nicotinate-nucleotide adenylyltransferase [Proteobacteria bacterium]|nr:nicotinate-nucleotide adenylyltransferase [Pseudomonadota bacterium]NOG60538.1 nicotinate-nucleotide adenylyltransferase [Pseudomonadota bacterium]
MRLIGILGGTFDPIHDGHLRLALEAQEQLSLEQVRLVPVNIPPHRETPVASAVHRQRMIELAINEQPYLFIDCRELESKKTSYSINTLKSLRQEYTDDSLCLILGHDAFNKIDSWKDWQTLLEYAHIIVANRPNESSTNVSNELQTWTEEHQIKNQINLKTEPAGAIYFINIPMLDISSSMIRQRYMESRPVNDLLPTTIQTYIKDNNLYLDTA